MSEHFTTIEFERLLSWILSEYKHKNMIFGIPKELFFNPKKNKKISMYKYSQFLETPLGVAAGPHTQLAQNIICAWLCGARYIELKTIQVLDKIKVSKPCIDAMDEGFNCEWSQELTLEESFDEYLKAWIIIHILQDLLKHENTQGNNGFIFNMSAGYNLECIQSPTVQNFLGKMNNAGEFLKNYIEKAIIHYDKAGELNISEKI